MSQVSEQALGEILELYFTEKNIDMKKMVD